MEKPGQARRKAKRRRRPASSGRRSAVSSREALLRAATAEFAASGYDGATVDRIAARARLNKAMIYYHFRSKRSLYAAILREWFDTLLARVGEIARSPDEPGRKVSNLIETIVREGERRPALPRMMIREIADGGRHLETETVRAISRIPKAVAGIIEEGIRSGRFVEADPFLVYIMLLGPIILFLVTGPVRHTLVRFVNVRPDAVGTEAFINQLQSIMSRGLDAARPSGSRAGDQR